MARTAIAEGHASLDDPRGIVFEARPAWTGQRVAFLFPGQGAQSPGMLRELAVLFPEVRATFEEFDRTMLARGGRALGPLIFPPPAYGETADDEARRALMETDVAQPAVGAACVAMLGLLRKLGCEPDMLGGHSYGELVALHAAGAMSAAALAELSQARGRFMREAGQGAAGSMAAILAAPDDVERLIRDVPGAQAANWNGPRQTVIAGPTAAVKQALDLAAARGIAGRLLPVSSAFHTPLVAPAREPVAALAGQLLDRAPGPAGLFQSRRGSSSRRPRGDRGTAGRSSRRARAFRRDDRGDASRRCARVRGGRTGFDSHALDRLHLERSASSGRFMRSHGIIGSVRLAPRHRTPGRGRTAAPARVTDPGPDASRARSGTSARR